MALFLQHPDDCIEVFDDNELDIGHTGDAEVNVKIVETSILPSSPRAKIEIIGVSYTPVKSPKPTGNSSSINFYYFIGRANPPHAGHIFALETMVRLAQKKGTVAGTVALILLGSGPQHGNPLDNPISFELKSHFIASKLSEVQGSFEILEMNSPAKQVQEHISGQLFSKQWSSEQWSAVSEINIYHVAGGKDEDTSKLDFIKKFAIGGVRQIIGEEKPIAITATTIGIDPVESLGTSMSATAVRKAAYSAHLKQLQQTIDNGFKEFESSYGTFYDTYTEPIYEGIIARVTELSVEYGEPSIDILSAYLTGVKCKKKKGVRRGGRKSKKITKRKKPKKGKKSFKRNKRPYYQ